MLKALSSIMSLLAVIFFLLCLSLHACNARRLGFVADHVDFAAKDVNNLKPHDVLGMKPSNSKELKKLQEVGRRIQENLIGANTMKQTLLNYFLKTKEAVAKAISGHGIVISSRVDLQSIEKMEGLKRVRSMLGNSGDESKEAVDSKEKDNVKGDIDVMDYAQPHRKPPIHNEKN